MAIAVFPCRPIGLRKIFLFWCKDRNLVAECGLFGEKLPSRLPKSPETGRMRGL